LGYFTYIYRMSNKFLFFLLFIQISFSQGGIKTIEVNGGNWIEILRNCSYYIDSTNTNNVVDVSKKLTLFKKNNSSLLSLKKQPYNLWVHLKFKNNGQKQKYWLGFYSQADTLFFYERNKSNEKFRFKSFSDYSKTSKNRNLADVRFHYASFDLNQNQDVDVLMLIKNRKHFSNIYADFTTPHDNLNWEKGFYWIIGSFVSIFIFAAILCFLFGLFLRKKLFVNYAFYLIITALFILHEELFISIFEIPWIYNLLYRSNSNFLMTIAVGLNMHIFCMLTNLKTTTPKLHFYVRVFSNSIISYGLFSTLIIVLFPQINFLNTYFNWLWNMAVYLNILCVILNAAIIFFYFFKQKKYIIGFLFGVLLLILNPVIYYLNYSKVIELYQIQHPNYYYYVILLEILLLGFFIILQFRKAINEKLHFLREKIKAEENLKIEKNNKEVTIKNAVFESQSVLLSDLSKDLHDDLGQKLSVISISLENLKLKFQSEEIHQLKQITVEVSDSIRNLSHWLREYEFQNKEIDEIIEQDILRINKLRLVQIKIRKNEKISLNTNEKIIIFRVYQELLNNSLKHAKPTHISIDFFENQIVFSDNGVGFKENSNEGNGLKNIIERLQIINWKIERIQENNNGVSNRIFRV